MSNVVTFGFLGSVKPNIAALGFLGGTAPPVPVAVTSVPGPADGIERVLAAREKRQYWDDYVIRLLLLDQ